MNRWLTFLKSIMINIFFPVLVLTNALFWQNQIFGLILLFFFVCLIAKKAINAFSLLSGVAIIGSIAFYAASFDTSIALVIFVLSLLFLWIIKKTKEKNNDKNQPQATTVILTFLALTFFTTVVVLFFKNSTLEAVRSLWTIAPTAIFWFFGLGMGILIFLLTRPKESWLVQSLITVALFVFLSAALLIFPIGYGFDAFIHQATEKHLAEFGTITPKPFYYIGQYVMVLFLHFVFSAPIEWTDKLLLPLLTAVFLPTFWFSAASSLLKNKTAAAVSTVIIFLLPLTSFIVTTPQGLGNLWFFSLLLLAIPYLVDKKNELFWPLILGAAATLLIHPIAGLPTWCFLIIAFINANRSKQKNLVLKRIFSWIIILFGGLALPASFILNNLRSGQELGLNLGSILSTEIIKNLSLSLFFENRFSPILDFVYLFGWNQIILLIIGASVGLIWSWKTHRPKLFPYLAITIVLIINFVIIHSAIDFSFLIDYERGNYAGRLMPLIIFCLTPFLIIFAGQTFNKISTKPLILRIALFFLTVALVTSAFYLNYPRHDSHEINRGFNVSQADLVATLEVEKDGGRADFIVLANQSTAAAALKQFGFARYFDDQFYYPIPTGNPLYQLFLNMNEHSSVETITAAMNLVGVNQAYYLVSDYWWQSEKIIETAKTTTDEWWSSNDGKITIFKYQR